MIKLTSTLKPIKNRYIFLIFNIKVDIVLLLGTARSDCHIGDNNNLSNFYSICLIKNHNIVG